MNAIRPGRPRVFDPKIQTIAALPGKPAIYRIVSRNNRKILYVGETNNLKRRIVEHTSVGKVPARLRTVHYMLASPAATYKDRRLVEKMHIERHNPRLNGSAGGEGRSPVGITAKNGQALAPAASSSWLARLWPFSR
jgi:excinuclease UvrABC nuclease subunit